MSTAAQLQSIATALDTYRTQFAAMGNALTALRAVSDQMIARLDQDRETLESHLQAALQVAAATEIATVSIAETEPVCSAPCLDATSPELASEFDDETVILQDFEHELIAALEHHADLSDEPMSFDADLHQTSEEIMPAEPASDTEMTTAPTAPDAAKTEVIADVESIEPSTAGDTGESKVVSLTERRKSRGAASPARRRAMAIVASILVTASATVGLHELLQTELGQRMLELGTCDGDMLSATRDCSLLSWLMI